MDFTQEIEGHRRALLDDIDRRIEQALSPFADALDAFLGMLFQGRLPPDWRKRWHAFVEEQAANEFPVEPQSVPELEVWIEAWAAFCGLLPITDDQVVLTTATTQSDESAAAFPTRASNREPTHGKARESEFDGHLARAQAHLDEMHRSLAALGQKLDAAKVGDRVDVDSEATTVEELVWRYHDALESARETWLRDDLSGDANTRLLGMWTPASFGLPFYFDDQQAERARKQLLAISRRLHARNVTMDRIVSGVEWSQTAITGASILVGGAVVVNIGLKGGRWAVIKTLTAAAAALAAEQGIEKGLRAVGAGEQTIKGIHLAVAVITFIILRRRSQANSSSTPGLEKPPIANAPRTQQGVAPAPQVSGIHADRGIWDLGPVTRGEIIHQRMAQNVPRSFPTIDIFKDGVVTSIKSVNLQAKSYQKPEALSRLCRGFVDKVARFREATRAGFEITEPEITGRALQLVIPPGATMRQQIVLNSLKLYGESKGVKVTIVEMLR